MGSQSLVLILAALIGGGGLTGFVLALLRIKPERESIIVTAAQGAVVIQSGVIDDLQAEMDRLRNEVGSVKASMDREVAQLRKELSETRQERDRYRRERDELRRRVETLESQVERLERKNGEHHPE